MSSLSIRHMNFVLQEREHMQNRKDHEWYLSLPEEVRNEKSHYWFIERKAKRGNKWIFVRDLMATKREAADIFVKHFRGREPKFRIRHMLVY